MISFEQLCELLTTSRKYSWFYYPIKYLESLTKEEKSLIHIQSINDETFVRLYYPREKFFDGFSKEGLMNELIKATEVGDIELIRELKERIKTWDSLNQK